MRKFLVNMSHKRLEWELNALKSSVLLHCEKGPSFVSEPNDALIAILMIANRPFFSNLKLIRV